MKLPEMQVKIAIPQGCHVSIEGAIVKTKGPKGTVERKLIPNTMKAEVKGEQVVLTMTKVSKKEKRTLNTTEAHIKNMIRGVLNVYTYKLKVCSGHFPMTVKATKDEFSIKNFLGEKVARTIKLKPGVDVQVSGQEVVVSGPNLELTGTTAAAIEQLTFISRRDRRIFQDGIYIIQKPEFR